MSTILYTSSDSDTENKIKDTFAGPNVSLLLPPLQ